MAEEYEDTLDALFHSTSLFRQNCVHVNFLFLATSLCLSLSHLVSMQVSATDI